MRIALGSIHHAPSPSVLALAGLGFGLGDCTDLGMQPWGHACRDNRTGNMVLCTDPSCSQAAAPIAAAPGPTFVPTPVIESIPVGGFTGDIPVPTLASALGDELAALESSFEAGLIAKGVDTVSGDASQFALIALNHCATYPNSSGCSNRDAIVNQFAQQFQAWAKTQPANAYQSGDSGYLLNPILPSTPSTNPAPAPGGSGGSGSQGASPQGSGGGATQQTSGSGAGTQTTPSGGGSTSNTSGNTNTNTNAPAAMSFDLTWFTDPTKSLFHSIPNWALVAGAVVGVYLLTRMGGRR